MGGRVSLHFDLEINGIAIGHFNARRIAGGTNPDDINTYDVKFTQTGLMSQFRIDHRYGDGAWELVRKSCEELQRIRALSPTRRPEHMAS